MSEAGASFEMIPVDKCDVCDGDGWVHGVTRARALFAVTVSHGDPTPVVTSFHMETSQGGIPITLCSCGLLIYQPMATTHMRTCDAYRRTLRAEVLR